MTISLDFSKLAPLITPKTLILTPNARTQSAIYTGQLSTLAENQVVESLDVRSFSQWQNDLWSELSFYEALPKRLSDLIIKSWLENQIKNEPAWTLTNPSGVAVKIIEAYRNLVQWELCLNDVADGETLEIDYFKKWIRQLQDFNRKKNLVSHIEGLTILLKQIGKLKSCLPSHILLVGFNQFTPLEERFFESLKRVGNIEINRYDYKTIVKSAHQINFVNLNDELNFAANYANLYQKDGSSIGIVVNQLSSHLGDVHHAFSKVFQPCEIKPWVALNKPKYNVSAGFSLFEHPLVTSALLLLNLNSHRIKLEEIHYLKNTPHINWGEQKFITKIFLHDLCMKSRKYYSVNFIKKCIAEQSNTENLSLLSHILEQLSNRKNNQMSIERHIEKWHSILNEWHWAEFGLNEFELQAKKMFLELINDSLSLSDLSEQISSKDSLNFLKQSCMQQPFQIASDHSNVHVLGVLEATGLQFDHLLVVGFNCNSWPQKNKINPFLPLLLQREKNMPGSSAEREYEYAKDLSNSLLHSAENIIVASSNNDVNDASSFSQVPLFFAHLPTRLASDLVEYLEEDELFSDYQWVEDSTINLSKRSIRGGAYLLSDYAKCPFQSIAKHQLKIMNYQVPEVGIEPKTKGIWLHETMEIIWQILKSQKMLLQMKPSELKQLISDSLETAMQKHHSYLLTSTAPEIIELELDKLSNIIDEWLSIEKNRDEFWIAALEKDYVLEFNNLNLRFRIDRVDRIKNNQIEIIDYKTGKTDINNWFGVRPIEAQMPAYVLAMQDKHLSGLSYARIKTGEVEQTGLSFNNREESILKIEHSVVEKKVRPLKLSQAENLDELVVHWKKTLSRIADGIAHGYMAVSPKDINKSCLYCDYKSVCRIDEIQPNE